MKDKKQGRQPKLEDEYEELFKPIPKTMEPYFVPPSPLKIVQTVTTYGAYEEPI